MTRTINLYDGLEALYYFDTDYWDGGANELSDQSGHGRHATASGGPTIGAEGPASFEAASFDGNDDYFDSGSSIPVSGAQTMAAIVKLESVSVGDDQRIVSNFDGGGGMMLIERSGSLRVRFRDGSTNQVQADSDVGITGEWYLVVSYWDGSTLYIIVNGVLEASASVSSHSTTNENFSVGARSDGTQPINADIAVGARWSRDLSWPEVQHLNRLTAPRRALL